jgi:hypothetical protein
MSTIIPHSELARRAIAWIDERLSREPDAKLSKLIDKASMQFNLGPKDADFLKRFFSEKTNDTE